MSKGSILFVSVFIFSILFQSLVWTHLDSRLVDKSIWTDAIQYISTGNNIGPDSLLYGYPAFTILSTGKFITKLRFDNITGFYFIIIFFLSTITAGICLITYILEPEKPWWLTSLGLISLSPYLANATPPSIIVSVLIPLIILLGLLIYTSKEKSDAWTLVLLGILGGLSLSTRIDITVAVCGLLSILLIRRIGKNMVIPIFTSGLIFSLFSFSLHNSPLGYFTGAFTKSHLAYSGYFGKSYDSFIYSPLFSFSIVAITSIIIGSVIFLSPKFKKPTPRNFFLWLIAASFIICTGLFVSSYHPVWYFFPLITTWELFLPLFIFNIIETKFSDENYIDIKKIATWSAASILSFIHIGAFLILFIN